MNPSRVKTFLNSNSAYAPWGKARALDSSSMGGFLTVLSNGRRRREWRRLWLNLLISDVMKSTWSPSTVILQTLARMERMVRIPLSRSEVPRYSKKYDYRLDDEQLAAQLALAVKQGFMTRADLIMVAK